MIHLKQKKRGGGGKGREEKERKDRIGEKRRKRTGEEERRRRKGEGEGKERRVNGKLCVCVRRLLIEYLVTTYPMKRLRKTSPGKLKLRNSPPLDLVKRNAKGALSH